MKIEIVTPDKKVYEGDVESAIFPGINGSFEVLNSHAALISALSEGAVKLVANKKEEVFRISGGVVEVNSNKVSVLAEAILA